MIGGAYWDIDDRSRTRKLFIGHTCSRAAADENKRLDSEELNLVHIVQSMWDVSNVMFTEAFS